MSEGGHCPSTLAGVLASLGEGEFRAMKGLRALFSLRSRASHFARWRVPCISPHGGAASAAKEHIVRRWVSLAMPCVGGGGDVAVDGGVGVGRGVRVRNSLWVHVRFDVCTASTRGSGRAGGGAICLCSDSCLGSGAAGIHCFAKRLNTATSIAAIERRLVCEPDVRSHGSVDRLTSCTGGSHSRRPHR